MKSEKVMSNQLRALDNLLSQHPEHEEALGTIRSEVASGKTIAGQPLRMPKSKDPASDKKARQMQFLEALEAQYPDRSEDILKIKHDLSK